MNYHRYQLPIKIVQISELSSNIGQSSATIFNFLGNSLIFMNQNGLMVDDAFHSSRYELLCGRIIFGP